MNMGYQHEEGEQRLAFFLTRPHPCGYLPERWATTLFADPAFPMTSYVYQQLLEMGFRRSGGEVYQPHCPGCRSCVPVRLPSGRFKPSRTMTKVWRHNDDLAVSIHPAHYRDEYFELYTRYLAARHADGPMEGSTPDDFLTFLDSPWLDVAFVEFRLLDRLVMVAVTDLLPYSLSAVYTFFDPEEAHRSLGTYAILWQARQAREWSMPWLYLGYWVPGSDKMDYKSRFRPLEGFVRQEWRPLPPAGGDPDRIKEWL